MYDLQHGLWRAGVVISRSQVYERIYHCRDVMTCGVLSRRVYVETEAWGLSFVLLVWQQAICEDCGNTRGDDRGSNCSELRPMKALVTKAEDTRKSRREIILLCK